MRLASYATNAAEHRPGPKVPSWRSIVPTTARVGCQSPVWLAAGLWMANGRLGRSLGGERLRTG